MYIITTLKYIIFHYLIKYNFVKMCHLSIEDQVKKAHNSVYANSE